MNRIRDGKPVALAILGVALVAAILLAIHGRAPWYDEFYTYYVTRPGTGFGMVWPAWMRDNHPPLFYFAAWATNWLGPAMADRRLLNLGFFAGAVAALCLIGRARPDLRGLLFAYAVALAGYQPMIERVAELRSNFLAYAAGAVAVAALTAFAAPFRVAPSRKAAAGLTVTLAVAFFVHLSATLIVGAVAAAFGLRLILARDWQGALRLAGIGLAAAIPFVATMAFQAATIAGNTRTFWIPAGFDAARWAIELETIANLTANWPLTLAGLAGLALLAAQVLSQRRLSPEASLVLTLAGGLALATGLLIAVHLQRPFVIGRYLVCLHPPIAMILATGVAALAGRLGRKAGMLLDVALVAGALLAIHGHLRDVLARAGWDGTASAIARLASACPGTKIYADTYWNQPTLNLPPADNRAVMPFAYAWVARDHGFALAPASSHALAAACPTVFWTEHVPGQAPDARTIRDALRHRGFPVTEGHLRRIGDGWIFVARPHGG